MTQQKAPKIERYEVVTVASHSTNQYGDLEFTDNQGKAYKIGNKRPQFFEAVVDGRAVKLGYAVYKDKEYIASAVLFDGVMEDPKPPVEPEKIGMPPAPKPQATTTSSQPRTTPYAPQEIGLWWKELGCRIGDGSLAKAYPNTAVRIMTEYYRKMSQVTGIKFGE